MTGRKLLGLIGSLAVTAALIVGVVWVARSSGSGGEGAAVAPMASPTPTSEATPAPAMLTPTPTPPPRASPTPLPEPASGYVWWIAPPNSPLGEEAGIRRYAVQVPLDFTQPRGPYLASAEAFVPDGVQRRFPYPPVPQLTILVSPVVSEPPGPGAGWEHPFVWNVGSQGGAGCTGDVAGPFEVSPSRQYTADAHTWDVFTFTCHVENLNYPPGVSYDGHAAEIRVADLICSVVVFQPVGSQAMDAAFQKAMDSFTLQ